MHLQWSALAGLTLLSRAYPTVLPDQPTFEASYTNANKSNFIAATGEHLTLEATNGSAAIVILDYHQSVEGFSAFEVTRREGDTSAFEITYGETRAALSNYMSDGPLPLAATMDTYRVNRYNISAAGEFKNRLIQGAFRYQQLNLSSPGALTLKNVGVYPTIDTTPISQLPGKFHSSNRNLNRIWSVGARTIQMTEIHKNTIPDFVDVTPDGTLVESLAPQVHGSAVAAQLMHYIFRFQVKPLVGGFGFTVLSDTLNSGIYISCDLTQGIITAHAGSTSEDRVLASFTIATNSSLAFDRWHTVQAEVDMTEIKVMIDGFQVLQISQATRFVGSFGFGASFGHRAMFRDLTVINQGERIFAYNLTDPSFLKDFFMGSNPLDTVVDGSRRDRIAYTGDLDVAGKAALASTHGLDYILGSLDLLGSYQATPGFFIPTAKIQQTPLAEPLNVNVTGLIGYSFNFLTAVAATYMHTGDVSFAQKWAPRVQKMLEWADSQCLENGIFNVSDASFGGDWNYYDPAQSGVVTKFNVLYAYALQECQLLLADGGINTAVYQSRLEKLRLAIDEHLWSDELQAYCLSENVPGGFGQDSNAIAILAGVNVNPKHSTRTILSTLSQLMQPAGPLAFSKGAISAGFRSYISPYASAYHLRAAMTSSDSHGALELLKNLWLPMADEANTNYTGAFWETLDENGKPGLGLVTSLCHGWSAGPTAELSSFVLGARPTKPGWVEFEVAPLTLGSRSAQGSLPTTKGNIDVSWEFDHEGLLKMVIEAPVGTHGAVSPPHPLLVAADESVFYVGDKEQTGLEFKAAGGSTFVLSQKIL